MIPGEPFPKEGEIEPNAGRETTVTVANTGDRHERAYPHPALRAAFQLLG